LFKHCVERGGARVLSICDSEARWGRFEDLEAFLVSYDIPFDRYSDGKYEYDPEWISFRVGEQPRLIPINSRREPQIELSQIRIVCQELDRAISAAEQGRGVIRLLRRMKRSLTGALLALPAPLPALTISPAEPAAASSSR
jgi:hypothetical protein